MIVNYIDKLIIKLLIFQLSMTSLLVLNDFINILILKT